MSYVRFLYQSKVMLRPRNSCRSIPKSPEAVVSHLMLEFTAAFCTANPEDTLDAAAAAVAAMGLCGELAFERLAGADGTGSYRTYIIDAMSNLDDQILEEGRKVESR